MKLLIIQDSILSIPLKWGPDNNSEMLTESMSSPLSNLASSVIATLTCATPKSFSNSTSASAAFPCYQIK